MSPSLARIQGLRAAFTLVEVVVVLAILGVTLLIAIPELLPARDLSAIDETASRLTSELNQAQRRALQRGIRQTVVVDQGRREVWFDPTGAARPDTIVVRLADETRLVVIDAWGGGARVVAP